MAVADEIFAHQDDRLEQALRPTMRTRRSSQFVLVSTAGDEKSFYLWNEVTAGRTQCETGDHGNVAYFEWSAKSPNELGLEEHGEILNYLGTEQTWLDANPAIGHTITADTIRGEWMQAKRTQDGIDQFQRTALNIWVNPPRGQQSDGWSLISEEDWTKAGVEGLPMPKELSVSACIVERQWALGACQLHNGRPVVDLVATGVGIDGIVAEVAMMLDRGVSVSAAIDPSTTAATVLSDLMALSAQHPKQLKITKVGRRESMSACMRLVEHLKAGTIGVLDSEGLTGAACAATRVSGTGELWEINRTAVTAPLVACALASSVVAEPTTSIYDSDNFVVSV
jgi:hypothetical protein